MKPLPPHRLTKQLLLLALAGSVLAFTSAQSRAISPEVAREVPTTTVELIQHDWNDRWTPPLAGAFEIKSSFVQPPHHYAAGHRGIDLSAVAGSTVTAPQSGTVHFAGTVVDRDLITIRVTDDLLYTIEPVETALEVGDMVDTGDTLGTVSHGGHCSQTCIHLGVRVKDQYVNPIRFFAGKPQLLPTEADLVSAHRH